ncbi:potassium-transporting ATPase subunit KdpB [Roseateles terrae]|uniref:Potassium-transporting ATPase ATP-binding subunit n=1 Tax=Roseateles terrae TaxID=431060 RepID=A0ABR6GMP1_9BURK|nr:potassium-transporting ATPase subunit KdpB [Roseateles terrae]MBB3193330.1 K+-transporting ATPase ATPase B chain [Roseateles terrae]OWQ89470.1 K(+)-transporting ATPase subunit B [Roseateles terrae]
MTTQLKTSSPLAPAAAAVGGAGTAGVNGVNGADGATVGAPNDAPNGSPGGAAGGPGPRVRRDSSLWDPALMKPALRQSFAKLAPAVQLRNPVMFVVYAGSILTTGLWLASFAQPALAGAEGPGFMLGIALWLWFTVLFANFAEALAEGRSKAQAASLRGLKAKTWAKKLDQPRHGSSWHPVNSDELRKGHVVLVEAGDLVPLDGEVIEGVASVDESAITGESAPVIRESGGDFSAVTGGTRVLSDWIVVRIAVNPGEAFLDRMIAMVEGAKRQKTPNEIALTILLVALTLVFLVVTVTLLPFSLYSVSAAGAGTVVSITALVALLVCLIPTTIGGLLSAIGVAGMSRLMQANVVATSGRAVEAAGDVDVLMLDKTGTITLGNRQASAFLGAPGITEQGLADAAQLASLADETPEGRSIVVLAKQKFNLRERELSSLQAHFVPFTAQTRMSGVDFGPDDAPHRQLRKGAVDAIRRFVEANGGQMPAQVSAAADEVARRGSTPLVVADLEAGRARVLGVVELKDIVKGGIKERFAQLRRMGIKTVMITGDNRLTAAAIAAEAGVDDFLAEATPEAKLQLIRDYQAEGRLVAMTGDGTNDAPALAQADVAVAMASGTQAAKEAGNMVDLDSNPTKLLEIVETGKQLLMTRGSLTTFSIANDVAKYFAIIPAMFLGAYPQLAALNVMQLHSPASAILSAVIFNALIIVALIPLALKGVAYRPIGASALLRRNLWIYGLGGLVVPFVGIKIIDLLLVALQLV